MWYIPGWGIAWLPTRVYSLVTYPGVYYPHPWCVLPASMVCTSRPYYPVCTSRPYYPVCTTRIRCVLPASGVYYPHPVYFLHILNHFLTGLGLKQGHSRSRLLARVPEVLSRNNTVLHRFEQK